MSLALSQIYNDMKNTNVRNVNEPKFTKKGNEFTAVTKQGNFKVSFDSQEKMILNGISVKYICFNDQDNRAGVLIRMSELRKAGLNVPDSDKKVMLGFAGFKSIDQIRNSFFVKNPLYVEDKDLSYNEAYDRHGFDFAEEGNKTGI